MKQEGGRPAKTRLLFVVPYPELKEKAEFVVRNHPERSRIAVDIRVLTVEEMPEKMDVSAYDAVIARGYSAQKIRQLADQVPVIGLEISSYDIVRAIMECKELTNPGKIAVISPDGPLYEVEAVCGHFGCQARAYMTTRPEELAQVIRQGLPTGIQNSVVSVGNLVIQTNINAFGAFAMSGVGAHSKIEGIVFLPIMSMSMALPTFVSQNIGAGEYERAKKGASFGILCSIITAELVGIFIYAFSPLLISAFNNDPQVIINGTAQARTVTLFYFLLAFSHCIAGILRGAGKSTVPMLVMMVCWCIIRVTYITVTVHFVPDIRVVFWAYPLTWFLSSVVFLRYFLKGSWVHGFER